MIAASSVSLLMALQSLTAAQATAPAGGLAPQDPSGAEVALEEGNETDFFEEDEPQIGPGMAAAVVAEPEEEEVVFADEADPGAGESSAPAFGTAFPEHDPNSWLALLPLALLALFTLNVRWRTPSR